MSICTGAAQARKHRVRVDASATQITTPSTQPRASATNNHARKSSCAGWGPIAAQQLPALSDLSNWVPPPHSARPLHGRSVHAGSICGHWPAPKPSRIPSPACMHKHGKLARVRWPRVPVGGVYPYRRRSDEERRRFVNFCYRGLQKGWVPLSDTSSATSRVKQLLVRKAESQLPRRHSLRAKV